MTVMNEELGRAHFRSSLYRGHSNLHVQKSERLWVNLTNLISAALKLRGVVYIEKEIPVE